MNSLIRHLKASKFHGTGLRGLNLQHSW